MFFTDGNDKNTELTINYFWKLQLWILVWFSTIKKVISKLSALILKLYIPQQRKGVQKIEHS